MKQNLTVRDIQKFKGQQTIVCLTAYDAIMATLLDQAGCDLLLVGDSLGNVILGHDNTLTVTMEDMLRHTAAVARSCKRAMVVADMPFLSYQTDRHQAILNAGHLLQAGAHAVKLEGSKRHADLIRHLVDIGIPVMGHIGMMSQSVHTTGGYRRFGKDNAEADQLMQAAQCLADHGAFAVVLECVESHISAEISRQLKIPTIGIGSGETCDGQILVINDLLGLNITPLPAFVRPKLNLAATIGETVRDYVQGLKHAGR